MRSQKVRELSLFFTGCFARLGEVYRHLPSFIRVLVVPKFSLKCHSPFLLVYFSLLCAAPALRAQQFTVGDSSIQINNAFFGGLNSGSSITFQGELSLTGTGLSGAAVDIDPEVSGLTMIFEASSSTTSADFSGVVTVSLDGLLENNGTISGNLSGVEIVESLDGIIRNNGTISGVSEGIFMGDASGSIVNNGTIKSRDTGVYVFTDFTGDIFNCGIIEGSDFAGIDGISSSGVITNYGGRITGRDFSISLLGAPSTVILSGPSHLQGLISLARGPEGSLFPDQVVRFENMRGINSAKKAELAALDTADPATGSVVLFGETIAWENVSDIQVNSASLTSYDSLITGVGLENYAASLDNVQGLIDEFREFLKALNDADASILNDIVANSSGQNLQNTVRDFARQQDINFFHLFSNQFSSLRVDTSGQLSLNQRAVQNNVLGAKEIQVGIAVAETGEEDNIWMTSYVGASEQDANGVRADADHDNTSLLFGRGSDLGNGWYFGGFGGYSRSDGRVDSFGSILENDGGWIGLNAQFRGGDAFANVVGALGLQDFASIRQDAFGNAMRGDTESFGGFIYGQAGRDFLMGRVDKGIRVTPYLGFTMNFHSVNGFFEQGPAGTALRFDDDSIAEFQTVLGVRVSGFRQLPNGWIRPRAELAWWHAFSGSNSYGGGLGTVGLLPEFSVTSLAANDDRGVLQVGFEFGSDHLDGWTFEAGYFGVLGSDDYSSHGGTFGARLSF